MSNHERLFAWWWSESGPRHNNSIRIDDLGTELYRVSKNLAIVRGHDINNTASRPVTPAGWNYAVMKFILTYCDIEESTRIYLVENKINYGKWRGLTDKVRVKREAATNQ